MVDQPCNHSPRNQSRKIRSLKLASVKHCEFQATLTYMTRLQLKQKQNKEKQTTKIHNKCIMINIPIFIQILENVNNNQIGDINQYYIRKSLMNTLNITEAMKFISCKYYQWQTLGSSILVLFSLWVFFCLYLFLNCSTVDIEECITFKLTNQTNCTLRKEWGAPREA